MSTASTKSNSLMKTMLLFLLPIVLANILQSFSQVYGSIMVGQTFGVHALAVISAFFPLYFFLISFAIGIGSGSSILIGQAFGGRNNERIKEAAGVTLALSILISIVLAVVGCIFAEHILRWMGTPASILQESSHYARILFATLPFTFLYLVYTTFLRGVGDSKTPFYFLAVSVILNAILLPLLLFGWLGLPKFGLYGAAYGAVVSNIVTFILLMLYLKKKDHVLKWDLQVTKNFRLNGKIVRQLMFLAIPTSVSMVAISMSEIAVITFVNDYGSTATAAYGVVNQIASYVQIPAMSISIAISVFAAQAIGRGEFASLKEIVKIGIRLNYMLGGILILAACLFAEPILSVFLTNEAAAKIAESLMLLSFWSYLFLGHTQAVAATMRAAGTVFYPTLFTILSIWIVEVPAAFVFSHYTSLEIKGIWLAYPAAFLANLTAQSLYYQFVWKKKRIQAII